MTAASCYCMYWKHYWWWYYTFWASPSIEHSINKKAHTICCYISEIVASNYLCCIAIECLDCFFLAITPTTFSNSWFQSATPFPFLQYFKHDWFIAGCYQLLKILLFIYALILMCQPAMEMHNIFCTYSSRL